MKRLLLSDLDREEFYRLYAEWEKNVPDPATETYEDAKLHVDRLRALYIRCHRKVEEVEDRLEGGEEK